MPELAVLSSTKQRTHFKAISIATGLNSARPMCTMAAAILSALALVSLSVIYVLYEAFSGLSRTYRSPLRRLKGPKCSGLLYGSFGDVPEANADRMIQRWTEEFGPTFNYRSVFNVCDIKFY